MGVLQTAQDTPGRQKRSHPHGKKLRCTGLTEHAEARPPAGAGGIPVRPGQGLRLRHGSLTKDSLSLRQQALKPAWLLACRRGARRVTTTLRVRSDAARSCQEAFSVGCARANIAPGGGSCGRTCAEPDLAGWFIEGADTSARRPQGLSLNPNVCPSS